MPGGPVVPQHREPWAKAFYVLHGRMAARAGEASYELGPGGFITVPPGTANTFEVLSPSVKFLAFSLGAGMGDFFADVGRPARDASFAELAPQPRELTARHGVTFAEQPLVTS